MVYEGLHNDTYESLAALAKAYNIKYGSLYIRVIKRGVNSADAIRELIDQANKIYKGLNNDTYKTLRDLAEAYGLNKTTLAHRLKSGMSIEEALTSNLYYADKVYTGLHNDTYRSISDMARAYRVHKNAIANRIKKGMSTQEALSDIINKSRSKPVVYIGLKNDTYKTIADLARAYNVPYYIFGYQIKNGTSTKEILINYFNSVNITYEGLNNDKYNTLKDLANAYNVSYALVLKMHKQGENTKDILKRLLDKPYKGIHGDSYRYKVDLVNEYGISYEVFQRALDGGASTQEAIKHALDIKNREYNDNFGNRYRSLSELVNTWDMRPMTIYNRLKAGIEMCVALVCKDAVKLAFISLDGKARYKLNWSDEPQTARQVIEYYRPDLLEAYDKHNPTGKYIPYRLDNSKREGIIYE